MSRLKDIPTDKEINEKLAEVEQPGRISFSELIKDHSIVDIPIEHQHNLEILLVRLNKIRAVWAKPMTITSGYRTIQDHLRIYRARGIADKDIPMGSQHLKGGAADILDRDGSLMKWARANEKLLVEVEVWVEDDPSQPRVHFQINPPKSGNRFFKIV